MSRNISLCHPRLQELAAEMVKKCASEGLIIEIGESFRTVAEQDALYAQGRTKPGSIITNAPGSSYSSMHQWGVAFDIYRNDGKGAYNESGNFFIKAGAIGKSLGLEWGGDWHSIVDKPHYQLPDWGSTPSRLKSLYGNVNNFKKTWGTATGSVIPAATEEGSWVARLQAEINAQFGAGLAVDGIAGPRTLNACPTVRRGARGNITRLIQETLANDWKIGVTGGIDGIFGEGTENAVMECQKQSGIAIDGIVGHSTWRALLHL